MWQREYHTSSNTSPSRQKSALCRRRLLRKRRRRRTRRNTQRQRSHIAIPGESVNTWHQQHTQRYPLVPFSAQQDAPKGRGNRSKAAVAQQIAYTQKPTSQFSLQSGEKLWFKQVSGPAPVRTLPR